MSEEIKRIEEVQRKKEGQEQSMSTNLTGEQIFKRSCNTCHPGGSEGMGPSLSNLNIHFPKDDDLKAFIRTGRGMMPAQTKEVLDDKELDNLVSYLRNMKIKK
jgi:mono/diheme cytochrome c family protein